MAADAGRARLEESQGEASAGGRRPLARYFGVHGGRTRGMVPIRAAAGTSAHRQQPELSGDTASEIQQAALENHLFRGAQKISPARDRKRSVESGSRFDSE